MILTRDPADPFSFELRRFDVISSHESPGEWVALLDHELEAAGIEELTGETPIEVRDLGSDELFFITSRTPWPPS